MGRTQLEQGLQNLKLNDLTSFELNEQKFVKLVTEVEDYAVILLSTAGTIVSWNKGAEKITLYPTEEAIGKDHRIFYPKEENYDGLPDILLNEAAEKGRTNYEGWRIRKDGSRLWGEVTLTAIHDDKGKVTGFLTLTRDLTEKKVMEDKLGNIVEELHIKNEELSKSQERYHKMMSEVQDYAIILLDVDGKILDWNKGAEKLKGYKTEEIIGKSFRLFYPVEDKKKNLPQLLLDQAKKNGYVTHEGFRIKKDGTRFWGSVAITALHDDGGQIIGFSKVTKDLTERKIADDRLSIFTQELGQKNEELRQSEERYHKMIAEVQDYAILLLDKEGFIQNWNAGAEFIKGYTAKEIIGKNFRLFYTPEDLKKDVPGTLLKEAEKNGKATSEGWRRRKDGSRFWGSIVITALHDTEGAVIGFSKVTRDLTAKKKADDAMKKNALDLELKNMELEKLNTELSSFAYVVSHDLKEPIRKIQVFGGRQLEPDKSIEKVREFAQKIVSSASRMQQLMESLLSYSLISMEPTELGKVDLNEILESVKADLELFLTEKGAVIKSDKLPVIEGRFYQLYQAILNLITNSVKFSKPDTIPQITISSRVVPQAELPEQLIVKNKSYYCLTFSDNGVGFDQDQSARIFEVFQRLKSKDDLSGTGIGLSIVKKVVDNHHGFVAAEGIPGQGARFRIYLAAKLN